MKKATFLITAGIIMVMLVGCQMSRTPIDSDTFKTEAEAAGYTVQNAVDQQSEEAVIDYLIAIKGEESIDYQIEFAIVPTVEQAKSTYQENRSTFEAQKESAFAETSVAIGNYSSYKLSTGKRYYVISRIENTFIYIDASSEYKDEIATFLKNIGY